MGSRPRYVVRSVKVAAGSFPAAAAVSALAALGAAPAEAAAAGAAPVLTQASAAAEGTLLREAGAPERQGGQGRPAGPGAA
ncbi:hypothetical protein HER39_08080, partial [Arthrobacter deserti]|nr:hypothetical protein [Arthrobacter deserti]